MSVSNTDNQKKVNDTKDLINSLKEIIIPGDLKQVIKLLQLVKSDSADSDEVKVRMFCENMWRIFMENNKDKDQ